jgi:hypothetical protein
MQRINTQISGENPTGLGGRLSDKPYWSQLKAYLACLHVLLIQVLRVIPHDERLEIVFEEQKEYEPFANLILVIAAREGPKNAEPPVEVSQLAEPPVRVPQLARPVLQVLKLAEPPILPSAGSGPVLVATQDSAGGDFAPCHDAPREDSWNLT